jgi:CubicO group peptidase (beta-lactamase class C family)
MILAALPLLALAGAGRARPQDSGGVRTQVDEIFKAFTRATPGSAVGADVKSQPVVRASYGMADLERDGPFSVDTIASPGSVAKQFTAAAVLLLERDAVDGHARRVESKEKVPRAATRRAEIR